MEGVATVSLDGWIPMVRADGGEIGFDLPHLAAAKRERKRMIRVTLKRERANAARRDARTMNRLRGR